MSALLEQRDSGTRRYYSIGRSRIGAWSVLPLHAREAANARIEPAYHGNAAIDVLEQPQNGGGELLKFLGEWTPPAVENPVDEPVGTAPSAESELPAARAAADHDFRLATDGELVALGSLVCLLTSILSVSALAGLAAALF